MQCRQQQDQLAAAAGKMDVSVSMFEKSFDDITADMLPTPALPPQEQMVPYGALYQTINSWVGAGAASPGPIANVGSSWPITGATSSAAC